MKYNTMKYNTMKLTQVAYSLRALLATVCEAAAPKVIQQPI